MYAQSHSEIHNILVISWYLLGQTINACSNGLQLSEIFQFRSISLSFSFDHNSTLHLGYLSLYFPTNLHFIPNVSQLPYLLKKHSLSVYRFCHSDCSMAQQLGLEWSFEKCPGEQVKDNQTYFHNWIHSLHPTSVMCRV